MTTLKKILKAKRACLLNIYCTAGYPQIDSLSQILPTLEKQGVDLVEIGIPYSDPISDGVTIQTSNAIALANGITLEKIFCQLEKCQVNMGKIMMSYFNVILQYGIESFCKRCIDCDVNGVILPDLPIEIYLEHYAGIFKKYGLSNIFLITPETSTDRVRFIDQQSEAFIYAVSSSSITGQTKNVQSTEAYLERLMNMNLKNPVLVGFNIRTAKDVGFVSQYCNGSIIGSEYIKHLMGSDNVARDTELFIQSILRKKA